MQRQSSGQKTPMLLQKFDRSRQQANTPKTQRVKQVAAVVAVCDQVLKSASGKPKTTATGDIRKFDFASGPGSLADILRARLAKGRP